MEKLVFNQLELLHSVQKHDRSNLITFPIKYRAKTPLQKGWKDNQLSFPELEKLIQNIPVNLAVLAGSPSENLVILDFDSMEHYEYLIDTDSRFKAIADNTHRVETDRGIHVYLRAPVPVKTAKDKTLNLDIKAQNSYCLTFPSIHPNGSRYVEYDNLDDNNIFVYPLESLKDIAFIKLLPFKKRPVTPSFKASGAIDSLYTYNALSPFYRDILRNEISRAAHRKYWYHEQGEPTRPDRSRADQALIFLLIKNGYELQDVESLYLQYSPEDSKYNKKGNQGRKYIETCYLSAEQFYFDNRNNRDTFLDKAFNIIIQGDFFHGRSRNSLKLVSMAFLYRMKIAGKMIINLSVRDIQIISGIDINTVHRAIKALQELYYLELTRESVRDYAAEYRFTPVFMEKINQHDSIKWESNNISTQSIKGSHITLQPSLFQDYRILLKDLFKNAFDSYSLKSLNRNSLLLVKYLNRHLKNELFLSKIISDLNMDRKTIEKKLRTLQEVVKLEKGQRSAGKGRPSKTYKLLEIITDKKLLQLAKITGTEGTARKTAGRINRERTGYSLHLQNRKNNKSQNQKEA